jgi:hypothetical protein
MIADHPELPQRELPASAVVKAFDSEAGTPADAGPVRAALSAAQR